jgi:hypothetical protein
MAYMILYARYLATYNENKTKNRKGGEGTALHTASRSLDSSPSKFMAEEILVDQLLFQI